MDNADITVHIDPNLADLVGGYLENRRRDLITIRAALNHHNFEPIRIIGHNLKGTGGGYGFDFISTIGDELEQAASRADEMAIIKITGKLADYLGRLNVVAN